MCKPHLIHVIGFILFGPLLFTPHGYAADWSSDAEILEQMTPGLTAEERQELYDGVMEVLGSETRLTQEQLDAVIAYVPIFMGDQFSGATQSQYQIGIFCEELRCRVQIYAQREPLPDDQKQTLLTQVDQLIAATQQAAFYLIGHGGEQLDKEVFLSSMDWGRDRILAMIDNPLEPALKTPLSDESLALALEDIGRKMDDVFYMLAENDAFFDGKMPPATLAMLSELAVNMLCNVSNKAFLTPDLRSQLTNERLNELMSLHTDEVSARVEAATSADHQAWLKQREAEEAALFEKLKKSKHMYPQKAVAEATVVPAQPVSTDAEIPVEAASEASEPADITDQEGSAWKDRLKLAVVPVIAVIVVIQAWRMRRTKQREYAD